MRPKQNHSIRSDVNTRTSIDRRTVLRGSGAALALPWLEAMRPFSHAAGEELTEASPKHPIRMAALFVPNGVRQDCWTPAEVGRNFELTPSLQPLQKVKDKLTVLTNLWNQASNVGDGHYVKTSGFLTCTTINKSLGIDLNCNGKSMDQVAADQSRNLTPDPVTGTGYRPGDHRRGHECWLYQSLRITHRMGGTHSAFG